MTDIAATQDFNVRKESRRVLGSFRERYRLWFHDDLSRASQSMALEETHLPRLLRLTVVTLSSAAALFLLWAAITPVKEIARTEGRVLPSGYSQIVQHLEGGLVREILVHEGDFVQQGQVLVRLDGAGLEEDSREQHALVEALSLQAERLHALIDNRKPDFTDTGASVASIVEQTRMYETMKDARGSERAVLDEQIAQKKEMIARLEQTLDTSRSNLAVAVESKKIYEDLNEKGLTSRANLLKKKQEYNSQLGEVNTLATQIEEGKRELAEFTKRSEALAAQQRDSAYSDLHRVEADLAQALEMLKKRDGRVARLEVRAPVTGYVQGLKLNTVGAVIPAGQTLMEIVPVGEQLIVEARILTEQIGRVAVGQEVQVKVDSFDYVRFGTIPGKLESLSAMTFTDEARRQDYYKGRVRLTRNYAGATPGANLIIPGMTVDADIVTGEKSVLGYLLKPIQVAMHNAMSEH